MKYLYIELNHYKRMPLTGSEHFCMVIENPIQMILGTNGSGKSSLVKELTPFPPNQNDFFKQGSKIVKIEHKGEIYTLKTIFSPSVKHSFVINDGENINEGGTLTVQKDLVREYFGFSQDINELLHDEELFSDMSPSRRKEWFISLCETDYSYAIRSYNKLKEKHRDCLGALKIAKKRLTTETEKVLKTQDEEKLYKEVTELHTLLSHLLEYRKPIESDTTVLDIEMSRIEERIYKCAQQLESIISKDTLYSDYTLDKLQQISTKIQQSLSVLNTYLDDYTGQYNNNQDKIKILQEAEQNTIDSLISDNQVLYNEKQDCLNKTMVSHVPNAQTSLESFQNIKSILTEICTTIPENTDRRYSTDALKASKQNLSDTQIKKQQILEYISNKQAKLRHLLEHKESSLITCTKCHHKFSLVYNEEVCSQLQSAISTAQEKLETVNKEIKTIQDYIDECLEYSILYRQYTQVISSHPGLSPYWDYLRENNVITNNPKQAIHLFNQFDQDLKLHVNVQNIQDKIQKNENLLQSLKNVGTDSLQSVLEANKALYANVGTITDKISSKSLKYNLINTVIQKKKNISALVDNIQSLQDNRDTLTKDYIETMRRSTLNALIKQLQSELGAKEHILHLASNQKSIIKNIEDQISDLDVDKDALSTLINQLSPTDGLIAQGLLGFIRTYIDQMNEFIEKVWSYPMTIMSCDIQDTESLDLDYKFPVKKFSVDDITPDISKCSRGMKEIINLAFKITAMKYLNLLDTPLYLDEFGSAMDNGHRNEVISLIKAFNEQKTFSQMFIVSHDVTQYSSLPNAQVCVLCDTNIITPKAFNQHVTIR